MIRRIKNCKKCYLFLIVLGFVILITAINDKRFEVTATHLPWQITVNSDGSSEVFGIHLGQQSMHDALDLLHQVPDTALFEHKDGHITIESYISNLNMDGLTAKMILEYDVTPEETIRIRNNTTQRDGTPSGAFKYEIGEDDRLRLLQLPVASITYIPYAQFDNEIILQRFGIAEEEIKIDDNSTLLLFPKLGLSITYNLKGKEILQYVAPRDFYRIYEKAEKIKTKTENS